MKPDNLHLQGANSGEQSTDEDTALYPVERTGYFCICIDKGYEKYFRKGKPLLCRKEFLPPNP